mmetsp:Transcript_23374/g.67360  ORF Transcript_23374/g.67360 Transcript_23374/m.67360 type:complete len:229 (+) Transcript_23374:673-1359(+)
MLVGRDMFLLAPLEVKKVSTGSSSAQSQSRVSLPGGAGADLVRWACPRGIGGLLTKCFDFRMLFFLAPHRPGLQLPLTMVSSSLLQLAVEESSDEEELLLLNEAWDETNEVAIEVPMESLSWVRRLYLRADGGERGAVSVPVFAAAPFVVRVLVFGAVASLASPASLALLPVVVVAVAVLAANETTLRNRLSSLSPDSIDHRPADSSDDSDDSVTSDWAWEGSDPCEM